MPASSLLGVTPPSCWIISDGAAGNERQAQALAQALGCVSKVFRITLRAPWSWWAPRFTLAGRLALSPSLCGQIAAPWPDIAIGCGRQAALITRLLKRWSGNSTFTVQILDPRIATNHFDIVVTPQHDRLRGANVVETVGALNPVDEDWLTVARQKFSELSQLPQPRTALLIGASHSVQRLDNAYFDGLLREMSLWQARQPGSFLVTTSRRTPVSLATRLRSAFAQWPGRFYAGPQDGDNPYAGFLAYADRIVVTPDSVNMLSEACASGKPVSSYVQQPLHGKLVLFHQALTDAGLLQRLSPSLAPIAEPLREAPMVTAAVAEQYRQHLRMRGSGQPLTSAANGRF